ncbi:unnamed protein product [Penicillium manginii]
MQEALRASNMSEGSIDLTGNKRLALVGDSVLSVMLLNRWYGKGGSTEEGDLILQKHACNKILDAKGQEWSLDKFITTHPAQKGEVSKGVRASTVEAIIGAVWLDSFKNAAEVDRVIDILGLYDD